MVLSFSVRRTKPDKTVHVAIRHVVVVATTVIRREEGDQGADIAVAFEIEGTTFEAADIARLARASDEPCLRRPMDPRVRAEALVRPWEGDANRHPSLTLSPATDTWT